MAPQLLIARCLIKSATWILGALGALAIAVLALHLLRARQEGRATRPVRHHSTSPAPAVGHGYGRQMPPSSRHVRGRVTGPAGPVRGVQVAIVASENPFDGAPPFAISTEEGRLVGQTFLTDDAGGYAVTIPAAARVFVTLLQSPGVRPSGDSGRWVSVPADDVDFRVGVRPTARVLVRVVDLSSGSGISGFRCGIKVQGGGYWQVRAPQDVVEQTIEMPEDAAKAQVQVSLLDPKANPPVVTDLDVVEGQTKEVELTVRSGPELVGSVVGPDGAPIADALVFFGGLERGRGDEPFKPFDPARIRDAVRTDANGRFTLHGPGDVVSVWHGKHSSTTVRSRDAGRLRVDARATLRGLLRDGQGQAVARGRVTLDRSREATTDDAGRFGFDDVEAGVRVLRLPDGRLVGARVQPAETVDVAIGAGIADVTVDIPAYPELAGLPVRGVVVGLDRLFSVVEVDGGSSTLHLQSVLGGRYLLLTTGGHVAEIDISGARATADFGIGSLHVAADRETSLYVLRSDGHELLDQLVRRVALRRCAPGSPVRYARLPVGTYAVKRSDGLLLGTVEVARAGAQFTAKD